MATIPLLFPDQPRGVAITPDGRFAYVTSASSQNVLVIDTASNTVVDTVTVTTAFAPTGIAVTPDGHFAYVAHSFTSSAVPRSIVSVIDTASNTVVATVPMDEASSGVAITPDGRFAYVTSADNVLVIDTARNTVVATVTVGSGPRGVAITPDGRFAYVASLSGGIVSIIETNSNTVVATVSVVDNPCCEMGGAAIPNPILHVTTGALPDGQSGATYSFSVAAAGGVGPRTFSVDPATLPPGLGMNSNGLITGSPSTTGTFSFEVTIIDSAIPPQTSRGTVHITINP